MSTRTDELVRELRRLDPDSPVLRHFPDPVAYAYDELARARAAGRARDRELERAFSGLRASIAALIQRGERDE